MKRLFLLSFLLLTVPALLLAEPKPKPPPIVTITKLDGSTVKGNVTSIDPRQVVVIPVSKPKEPPASAVTVTWKEIKSLSNGMTHKRMLDQWKKEHADQLCVACKGELSVRCDTCKGTGHDPVSAKDCKTCNGELLVDCKAPKCADGKVPCPAPCIKLSEGAWTKKDDGKRWRKFNSGPYRMEVSDSHVGELMIIKSGQGPELGGPCPTCTGKTIVDCPKCDGTKKVPCSECSARKDAPACPNNCKSGQVPCTTCEGVGLKKT